MSTAIPIVQNQVQYLEPARIRESPLNPRKTFNEKALEDLAADVAVHGVMQPILVRQISPSGQVLFEVIFGARRLRAAKMAKLESVRAFVEEMSDAEALERMMSENVQRSDFDAFEEADGYRRLHKEYGLTADAIAEKVGKSRAHVYGRMKLTELSPAARKVVQDRGLGPERALMIARIPDPARQLEAAQHVSGTQYYAGEDAVPMSVRSASTWIRDHFMLKLAGAPFDTKDAELVKKAGPCTTCPYRSTNTPDLFGDIGKADMCTKPACFAEKKSANWAAERKEAKDNGIKVLSEAAAKEVLDPYGSSGERTRRGAPFVALSDVCDVDPKRRTWKQLAGKEAPKPSVVARNRSGNLVRLVPREELVKVLEDRGHEVEDKGAKADGSREDRWQKQREREERERKEKLAVTWRAMGKVIERLEGKAPDKAFWRLVAGALQEDADQELYERRGWPEEENQKDIEARLDKMSEGQLRGFAFELIVGPDVYSTWSGPKRLDSICELYGVDLAKEKAALKEERLATAEAARQEAKEKDRAARARKPTTAEPASKVCSVPGCGKPTKSKGLCSAHYSVVVRRHKLAKA